MPGQLCSFMGRYEAGQVYLEESLAIAREIDDGGRIADALQLLGVAALGRGDHAAAHRYSDEALTMEREIGNEHQIATALIALAQFHRVVGDLDSAEPLYAEAREITHKLGDHETTAIALLNLAMVAIAREDAAKARLLLVETLRNLDELDSRPIGQSLIEVSAGLAALRARVARKRSILRIVGGARATDRDSPRSCRRSVSRPAHRRDARGDGERRASSRRSHRAARLPTKTGSIPFGSGSNAAGSEIGRHPRTAFSRIEP